MARPQNLKAREKILEAAFRLFHEHGFKGVSMHDVARAARLKKANLFHYYPTKDELGLAVLERASACDREGIHRRYAGAGDPIKTVRSAFEASAKRMEAGGCHKGCFIGNIAQELSDENPRMQRKIAEHMDFWSAELKGFLAKRRESGYFTKKLDPAAAAQSLISLLEGATLMCKATKKADALKNAGAMAEAYLRGFEA